jgi:hypothetical protein
MGSLEQSNDATLRSMTTSLPFFNATVGTAAVRSYHEVTTHAIPVAGDSHALLQRFCAFRLGRDWRHRRRFHCI